MDARLPLSVLLLARDETRRLESLIPALAFAREVVAAFGGRGADVVLDLVGGDWLP